MATRFCGNVPVTGRVIILVSSQHLVKVLWPGVWVERPYTQKPWSMRGPKPSTPILNPGGLIWGSYYNAIFYLLEGNHNPKPWDSGSSLLESLGLPVRHVGRCLLNSLSPQRENQSAEPVFLRHPSMGHDVQYKAYEGTSPGRVFQKGPAILENHLASAQPSNMKSINTRNHPIDPL